MHDVFEGKWDDLVKKLDLQGRRVKIVVLDEQAPPESEVVDQSTEEWLKRFREWVASHKPVNHFVDVSRDAIYSGTMDDPR